MAKVTEKSVRTATLQANQNSKHLLVGLQSDKGSKFYTVNVVARKTGGLVQSFPELSASEAHEAITMFDLAARVTALQINGLAGALENLLCATDGMDAMGDEGAEEAIQAAREALEKFRGKA